MASTLAILQAHPAAWALLGSALSVLAAQRASARMSSARARRGVALGVALASVAVVAVMVGLGASVAPGG